MDKEYGATSILSLRKMLEKEEKLGESILFAPSYPLPNNMLILRATRISPPTNYQHTSRSKNIAGVRPSSAINL